jgi:hypothetical protein
MRRPLLVAVLLVLAAGFVPASAATRVDVLDVLGKRVAKARKASGVRVLLPSRLTADAAHVYPGGRWRKGHYELELGAVRNCRQATACFVAVFLADEGARLVSGKRVALARGRRGWFTGTRCGASCAAPQVQWREKGVLYTLQAKGAKRSEERDALIRLANSAIRHGAR